MPPHPPLQAPRMKGLAPAGRSSCGSSVTAAAPAGLAKSAPPTPPVPAAPTAAMDSDSDSSSSSSSSSSTSSSSSSSSSSSAASPTKRPPVRPAAPRAPPIVQPPLAFAKMPLARRRAKAQQAEVLHSHRVLAAPAATAADVMTQFRACRRLGLGLHAKVAARAACTLPPAERTRKLFDTLAAVLRKVVERTQPRVQPECLAAVAAWLRAARAPPPAGDAAACDDQKGVLLAALSLAEAVLSAASPGFLLHSPAALGHLPSELALLLSGSAPDAPHWLAEDRAVQPLVRKCLRALVPKPAVPKPVQLMAPAPAPAAAPPAPAAAPARMRMALATSIDTSALVVPPAGERLRSTRGVMRGAGTRKRAGLKVTWAAAEDLRDVAYFDVEAHEMPLRKVPPPQQHKEERLGGSDATHDLAARLLDLPASCAGGLELWNHELRNHELRAYDSPAYWSCGSDAVRAMEAQMRYIPQLTDHRHPAWMRARMGADTAALLARPRHSIDFECEAREEAEAEPAAKRAKRAESDGPPMDDFSAQYLNTGSPDSPDLLADPAPPREGSVSPQGWSMSPQVCPRGSMSPQVPPRGSGSPQWSGVSSPQWSVSPQSVSPLVSPRGSPRTVGHFGGCAPGVLSLRFAMFSSSVQGFSSNASAAPSSVARSVL
eukprot:TRINITY_DN11207_c0_g1_i1.p1 TRINITY_DN11207_c0_g1~~TRINITY_DN11207_c0_g1_i1.p1  ORF type:complete len:683 (+),score=161.57 TRINITY_DN11207_c0_g1_i1:73-2049(+)